MLDQLGYLIPTVITAKTVFVFGFAISALLLKAVCVAVLWVKPACVISVPQLKGKV
jgi:hypothetical protein